VNSSYWTPFVSVGSCPTRWRWCGPSSHQGNWTGKEPPPKDIHYGGDEFITRSTMVFRKEAGGWRVVHTHFSEASAGERPRRRVAERERLFEEANVNDLRS